MREYSDSLCHGELLFRWREKLLYITIEFIYRRDSFNFRERNTFQNISSLLITNIKNLVLSIRKLIFMEIKKLINLSRCRRFWINAVD
jgi:hypothetical protein